jgi:hypothetical protein
VAALLALLAVLPLAGISTSESATGEAAQSLSGVLDTWSASHAGASAGQETAASGTGSSGSHMQLLLNPDADPHALLAAALEETR